MIYSWGFETLRGSGVSGNRSQRLIWLQWNENKKIFTLQLNSLSNGSGTLLPVGELSSLCHSSLWVNQKFKLRNSQKKNSLTNRENVVVNSGLSRTWLIIIKTSNNFQSPQKPSERKYELHANLVPPCWLDRVQCFFSESLSRVWDKKKRLMS